MRSPSGTAAGISLLLLAAALAGCGEETGFSGVSPDERVGALSTDEMRELCTWAIGEQGGEGAMYDCGGGNSVTLDTVDACVAEQDDYADCSLTVEQLESCVLAVDGDPCNVLTRAACQALRQCLFRS
jgi:hypothetical protein